MKEIDIDITAETVEVDKEPSFLDKIKGGGGVNTEEVIDFFEDELKVHQVFAGGRVSYFFSNEKNRRVPWDFFGKESFSTAYSKGIYEASVNGGDRDYIYKSFLKWCKPYNGLGFDPTTLTKRLKDNSLNRFVGFAIEPKEDTPLSACDDIYKLIVGAYGEAEAKYVFKMFGDILVNPGEKRVAALLITGPHGTYKTALIKLMGDILGSTFLEVDTPSQLTEKFNDHLANRLIVMGEEVAFGKDVAAANILKTMVSSEEIQVQIKNGPTFPVRDYSRICLLTNSEHGLHIEKGDRRWTVIETKEEYSNESRMSEPTGDIAILGDAVYNKYFKEPTDETLRTFAGWLISFYYANPEIDATKPISTKAKQELQRKAGSDVVKWLFECIGFDSFHLNGVEPQGFEETFDVEVLGKDGWFYTNNLYNNYKAYRKSKGMGNQYIELASFSKEILKYKATLGGNKRVSIDGKKHQIIHLGDFGELEDSLLK